MAAGNHAALYHSVNQFHRAVMPQSEPGRNNGDGRPQRGRQALYCEQELMLLRFKAVIAGGLLTEVEKLANRVAQFSELAVIREGEIGGNRLD